MLDIPGLHGCFPRTSDYTDSLPFPIQFFLRVAFVITVLIKVSLIVRIKDLFKLTYIGVGMVVIGWTQEKCSWTSWETATIPYSFFLSLSEGCWLLVLVPHEEWPTTPV